MDRALKTLFFNNIFPVLLLSAVTTVSLAQERVVRMIPSGRNAERVVSEEGLRADVEFLAGPELNGRKTGSRGANEAAFWIARRFEADGLLPIGGQWGRSFRNGSKVGHNIIGLLPGQRNSGTERYTIVAAHLDNLGLIDGVLYPGADSNASGVVAMLTVADMFKKMKDLGRSYRRNILFVALDAKEPESRGAGQLWQAIQTGSLRDPLNGQAITPDKIHSMVNLDILGSTLSPLHPGRKDYLMMLSGGHFVGEMLDANAGKGLSLDLAFNYYGSENFTRLFYRRIGDHRIFLENGIPSVLMTSGITLKTNKTEDTAESLDYGVFRKRIILIFHWLGKML